tara:strand:- start:6202 stop:6861 length:660 start_codon:yes stop_codon:yes gene_type:complete
MMTRSVIAIPKESTYQWLLEKHYARRIPQIVYAYGVFVDQVMVGVCTYGIPASPSLTMGLCGKQYKDMVVELNRLCLVEGHDKNLASYFVSQTLRMLPSPSIVVSYADTSMGHVGYVYQATNFLYTGLSAKRTEWRELGLNTHSRTVVGHYSHEERVNNPDRFAQVDRPQKHRYVYFLGTRKEKKELTNALKYPTYPYPKGTTTRYDDGETIPQQMTFL